MFEQFSERLENTNRPVDLEGSTSCSDAAAAATASASMLSPVLLSMWKPLRVLLSPKLILPTRGALGAAGCAAVCAAVIFGFLLGATTCVNTWAQGMGGM